MRHRHDDNQGDTIDHDHGGPDDHRHRGRVHNYDVDTGVLLEHHVDYGPAYPGPLKSGSGKADQVP